MENETTSLELIGPSALESITRAETDVQIATAHRYPRSMANFKRRALDMALIDEETAAACIYCRPVGMKNGQQQYAEGLSIRLAEIVGASYGNLRVGSMIIEQTDRLVKCRGVAHDLESNFASNSECVEPTVTKNGQPFSEGMRAVVAKACLAKAWRDALFKVVPRALCKPIELETRKLAAGDAKSLETRRAAVMSWVNKLGIDSSRVFAALGIQGEADIGSEHLLLLTGLKTAIKDGETTIEDAFPADKEAKTETAPKFAKKPKPEPQDDASAFQEPSPAVVTPEKTQDEPARQEAAKAEPKTEKIGKEEATKNADMLTDCILADEEATDVVEGQRQPISFAEVSRYIRITASMMRKDAAITTARDIAPLVCKSLLADWDNVKATILAGRAN